MRLRSTSASGPISMPLTWFVTMLPGPMVVRTGWKMTPMPTPLFGIAVPSSEMPTRLRAIDGAGGQAALDDDAAARRRCCR